MAKQRAKPRKQGSKSRKQRTKTGITCPHALAYAKLLVNPMHAPLARPLYSSPGSGHLVRTEVDLLINTGATETCSLGYLNPSKMATAIGNAGTLNIVDTAVPCVSDTAGYALAVRALTDQPGYEFLSVVGTLFRPVAAELTLTYVGSENNRSGIVAVGHMPHGQLGATNYPATIRGYCSHVVRTPDRPVTIRWRPSEKAGQYKSLGGSTLDDHELDDNCLVWSVSGLPAAAGIRIKAVVVYEWIPKSVGGAQTANNNRPETPHTIHSVLSALDRMGKWWAGTVEEAAMTASSVGAAVHNTLTFGRGAARLLAL